jgi:AraC-like DNA-binding protein/predicted transcriptional regulator YdeE
LNHIDKINIVLKYIEENLDADIHLDMLAEKCALSRYHFHRIFKALVGDPPLRYVETRRLARAGHDLQHTNRRVIDIAFDYGFRSHESFIRAFKKKYRLTPSMFRKIGPKVHLPDGGEISPLNLKLSHGKVRFNPRIVHRSAFTIAGLSYSGRDTGAVYLLWERFWETYGGKVNQDHKISFMGACFHDIDMRHKEVFIYYAGFETDPCDVIPAEMKTIPIPENDYAVFTHRGPINKIETTYDRLYTHWLPHSEHTPTMDLDIIILDRRFNGMDEKSEVDILIPIAS